MHVAITVMCCTSMFNCGVVLNYRLKKAINPIAGVVLLPVQRGITRGMPLLVECTRFNPARRAVSLDLRERTRRERERKKIPSPVQPGGERIYNRPG